MKSDLLKRTSRWLLVAGFCLLIFGGKLWFIDTAGSDLPRLDQWDAESEVLLRPWLEGRMGLKEIFHPHNEHRIVVTKLFVLGLFSANHQWDALVEMVAAAAVHTLSALLLLHLGRRWLFGVGLILYGILLLLLFTLPFSWENSIFGFQSTFYFFQLFSLGHIWLVLASDRFGWRWFAGQLSGALAVLTLASGFLSSIAIVAVLAHRFVRERRWTAQQSVTVALAVVFAAAGWLMKNDVPLHAPLRAHSIGQFIEGILQFLSWPGSALFPWSLLLFAPTLVFLVNRVRRAALSSDDAVLLGFVAWVLFQSAATSYARGGSGVILSPRYLDLLAVNVALGFVLLLREAYGTPRLWLAGCWFAAVVMGLAQQSNLMWQDFIDPIIRRQPHQEENVRNFVRTGDATFLLDKTPDEIPYPVGKVLVDRLSSPAIQGALPPSVRRSVPVSNGAPSAVPAEVAPAARPVALSTWSIPPGGAPFHWTSPRQSADALPVLRFRVAGDLGDAERHGRLVVKSAVGEAPVVPESAPGNHWKTVNVFRPAGEWWLEATAPDAGAWFAFTEPVEVGRWTWAAEKLLKFHFVVMAAGLAFLAAGAIALRRLDGTG